MDKNKKEVFNFRDLRVWQAGMDIVVKAYALTGKFPKHEIYGLVSQIRRAAVSIPSNIAEGHVRRHTREYLHFLSTAQGSLAEMETQFEIAERLGYLPSSQSQSILKEAEVLKKQIFALINALKSQLNGADYVSDTHPPSPIPHPL